MWSLIESILFNEIICDLDDDENDLTETQSSSKIVIPNGTGSPPDLSDLVYQIYKKD